MDVVNRNERVAGEKISWEQNRSRKKKNPDGKQTQVCFEVKEMEGTVLTRQVGATIRGWSSDSLRVTSHVVS